MNEVLEWRRHGWVLQIYKKSSAYYNLYEYQEAETERSGKQVILGCPVGSRPASAQEILVQKIK